MTWQQKLIVSHGTHLFFHIQTRWLISVVWRMIGQVYSMARFTKALRLAMFRGMLEKASIVSKYILYKEALFKAVGLPAALGCFKLTST
jgi:hypothetical protein